MIGNVVQNSAANTSSLVQAIVNRPRLTISDLSTMLNGSSETDPTKTAYVGFSKPEGINPSTKVFTIENLAELIPA
jgi:hypothetical protein